MYAYISEGIPLVSEIIRLCSGLNPVKTYLGYKSRTVEIVEEAYLAFNIILAAV